MRLPQVSFVFVVSCLSVCLSNEPVGLMDLQPAQGRIRKKAKYSEHQLPGGSESKCVPLVLEHFGLWGEEALRFLDQLSRNVVQFKNHWRKQLSVILQKCNARVLLKKLSRLSCDNIVADDLFDFDIQYQVH